MSFEVIGRQIDELNDRLGRYHEEVCKTRIDTAVLTKQVEMHDGAIQKMLRKDSPPPGPASIRGPAPFDAKKLVQVGAGILAVVGALGTAIMQAVETRQDTARTREAAEKSVAESRNELLRALIVVSRSAQSQAKSAEAMASPDPKALVEAEQEAVSVAVSALDVERDLVHQQIKAAPSPAKRQEAERLLADVQDRKRKIESDL